MQGRLPDAFEGGVGHGKLRQLSGWAEPPGGAFGSRLLQQNIYGFGDFRQMRARLRIF